MGNTEGTEWDGTGLTWETSMGKYQPGLQAFRGWRARWMFWTLICIWDCRQYDKIILKILWLMHRQCE